MTGLPDTRLIRKPTAEPSLAASSRSSSGQAIAMRPPSPDGTRGVLSIISRSFVCVSAEGA